jgi:hypothetical protein
MADSKRVGPLFGVRAKCWADPRRRAGSREYDATAGPFLAGEVDVL